MISSLRGPVIDIGLNSDVVECGGVGYLFSATPQTLAELSRGEEATVLTLLIVREDSMSLYGFKDAASRDLFSTLLGVSGVGPRLALAVQSVFNTADFAQAVTRGDAKALQRVPGVGKRGAERMIVELKEKVSAFVDAAAEGSDGSADLATANAAPLPYGSAVTEQVVEALMGLGFNEKQATAAVESTLATHPDADNSTLLRAALATLSS